MLLQYFLGCCVDSLKHLSMAFAVGDRPVFKHSISSRRQAATCLHCCAQTVDVRHQLLAQLDLQTWSLQNPKLVKRCTNPKDNNVAQFHAEFWGKVGVSEPLKCSFNPLHLQASNLPQCPPNIPLVPDLLEMPMLELRAKRSSWCKSETQVLVLQD